MQGIPVIPLTVGYFNGPQDWLIIGLIVLVIFGGAKIPALTKGLGEGIEEFRRNVRPQPGMYVSRGDSGRDFVFGIFVLCVICGLMAVLFAH